MRNRNPQQRLFIGSVIIVIGVLALIQNLAIFNIRHVLQFWPVVFMVLGALKINQSENFKGKFIGVIFVISGAVMTLNHMGIINTDMRDWWPLFLIMGGFFVIFKNQIDDTKADHPKFSLSDSVSGQMTDSASNRDEKLQIMAIMSGNIVRNSTQNFLGGEINAIFGSVELDLRGASIQTEAVLNVWASFGGVELKIPSDWTVINHGNAILGGIDDRTIPPMQKNKVLVIKGYVIFGGIEIIN